MKSRAVWVLVGVLVFPSVARATHPDHEGERGLELVLSPGVGFFGNSTDEVFLESRQFTAGNPALGAFDGTGFAAWGAVGWRLFPFVSAGVHASWQALGATGQLSASEARMGARDAFRTYAFGAHVRVYPLSFLASRQNPRVFFNSLGDLRRVELWGSLGVDFVTSVRRTRTYEADAQDRAVWTTGYVGVPLGFGADYRVTQGLAFGVMLLVTPLVGAGTTSVLDDHIQMGGVNQTVTTTTEYTPAAGGNTQVFLGFSARYTWTPR
ncbi:MAG: hypothetical protein HY909_03425 [Deltaproteobacteria bacterium]|nr:hypothetical protein [Deltaproteobacteria bacterium]